MGAGGELEEELEVGTRGRARGGSLRKSWRWELEGELRERGRERERERQQELIAPKFVVELVSTGKEQVLIGKTENTV